MTDINTVYIGETEKKKRRKYHLALCFGVPALILFSIYFFMQVYPFGDNSVLVLDLNGQYVYFFEQLRRIITEGGSFLYSFGRALGGEFMGIYAYYLASPLSYIVAIFPKENITEALFLIILIKCGLCGLTFGIYTECTRKIGRTETVMFSSMYALCAFCVVMQHNIMWTDCIFLLPLVMLGIRRMISKGKTPLYVLTLALAVLSNFYIGYMMCIFSAVYFFYAYFSMTDKERNPFGVKAHFTKSALRMFFSSITAAAIAAVIIIPTLYSLSLGKSTFSDPSFELKQKFDFADALTKLYFGSYDTVRPEGLPFLFTSMLTLITAPLYFFSKKVPLREKIASGILVLVFTASMNLSTVDIFWHGMQKPNWLNYRYAFMLVFFFILFSSKALEDIHNIGIKPVAVCFAFAVLTLFFLQKQEYENLPDLASVWASVGFLAVYLAILKFRASDKARIRETASAVLIIVVCFELFSSGLYNFYALDNDVSYSSRVGYRTYIDKMQTAADDIKSADNSFYRTEITSHRKTNDNMALGTYGLSGSTSTLNAETIKFLNRMGFASKSHWSKYLGQTPVSDSLLGVKYIIYETDEDVPSLYKTLKVYGNDGIQTVNNPYALPVAFGVSDKYLSCPFTDDTATPSPLDKLDLLVGYMTGTESDVGIFEDITEYNSYSENITKKSTADHIKYEKTDKNSDAYVSFVFEAPKDGAIYCYFPSSYMRECNLYVNGTKIGTYFGNETYRTVCLGTFTEGDGVNVRLELKKDEVYLKEGCAYFKVFNEEKFTECFGTLSECKLNVGDYTDDTIEGKITVKEGFETVFTSIAYDKEWKVYCDGESVETSKTLDALLTFTLPEGEHTVVMKYRPRSVVVGGAVSICGISAFVLLTVADYLLSKKAKSRLYFPQGVCDVDGDCYDSAFSERGFNFEIPSEAIAARDALEEVESEIGDCEVYGLEYTDFGVPADNESKHADGEEGAYFTKADGDNVETNASTATDIAGIIQTAEIPIETGGADMIQAAEIPTVNGNIAEPGNPSENAFPSDKSAAETDL